MERGGVAERERGEMEIEALLLKGLRNFTLLIESLSTKNLLLENIPSSVHDLRFGYATAIQSTSAGPPLCGSII